MLEVIEANNEHVSPQTQKFALSYTGHPTATNGELHVSYQKMEPEIRAPECKFAISKHVITQKVKKRILQKKSIKQFQFNRPFPDVFNIIILCINIYVLTLLLFCRPNDRKKFSPLPVQRKIKLPSPKPSCKSL